MSTTIPSDEQQEAPTKSRVTLLLPFLLVAGLLMLLGLALRSADPQKLPSALIGKHIPQFDLPPIPKTLNDYGPVPGLASATFRKGEVSILNVWASWCAPCQAEHPQLVELNKKGFPVYSINYKDTPEAARRFLARFGNPFRAIGADESGLTAIDFGVYGVPETFVIDGEGRVAYRFPGPLTEETIKDSIMPAIAKAKQPRAKY